MRRRWDDADSIMTRVNEKIEAYDLASVNHAIKRIRMHDDLSYRMSRMSLNTDAAIEEEDADLERKRRDMFDEMRRARNVLVRSYFTSSSPRVRFRLAKDIRRLENEYTKKTE